MSFIVEFQVIFCSVILILGFVGNLLVIITFGSKGARLKTYEVLMINLATADLLGTFCFPLLTILTLKSVDISFLGNFGCQLVFWLSTTSLTVSVFSLVAISIDRFVIVIWPLRKPTRLWKVGIVSILSWTMASFVGVINFLRVKYFSEYKVCGIKYNDVNEEIAYTVSLFLIQMIFPVIIMSTMYGFILLRLKSTTTRQLSVRSNTIREKRNQKLTKLFMAIIIVFYVLTLPYNIFFMWYTIKGKIITTENPKIQHVYQILALILLSNSCVNPLIYARLHESFRRNTVRILFPCLVKRLTTWRLSLKRGKSTSTTTTTPGSPSPYHSPKLILRSPSQAQSSIPVTEDKGDSKNLDPLPCGAIRSVMPREKNGYSPATSRVHFLKDDQTVTIYSVKALNETEEPARPRINEPITQLSPSSLQQQREVQLVIEP